MRARLMVAGLMVVGLMVAGLLVVGLMVAGLLVCAAAGPAMAREPGFVLGIKGGLDFATLSFDPERSPEPKTGTRLGGGVTLGYNLSPTLAIDADVLYMTKGTRFDWAYQDSVEGTCDVQTDWMLDYLVFSPMVRYAPIEEGVTPFFVAGVEVGFLLRANAKAEVCCGEQTREVEGDIKDVFGDQDGSLIFGLGVEVPLSYLALTLEGRYVLGLADIAKVDDAAFEIRTRGIYLLAGLRF